MDKVRITEVASEVAKKPKEVLEACKALGIEAKAAQSSVTVQDAQRIMEFLISGVAVPEKKPKAEAKQKQKEEKPKTQSGSKKEEKPKRRRRKTPSKKEKSTKQETQSAKDSKEKAEKKSPPLP